MDRRERVRVLSILLLLTVAALGVQAATAEAPEPATPASVDAEVYPGETLVTVQSYGWFDNNNGQALIVNRSGAVRWRFDPPNSRVFDGEALENGNVLLSVATRATDACPPQYGNPCVHNRVLEVDPTTNEVAWKYTWFDDFIHNHEVHDADRLADGRTAIVDMGNDRAFIVNRRGSVVWEWRARNHIGPGTEFWAEYVPESNADAYRPGDDWTHMNDVDRLANGNLQLSIRNFDVVVEVSPTTGRIVDVIGRPGNTSIMHQQHNPMRLERAGTLLVADSENDRVVELDAETGRRVWSYSRGLQWPRDADRLPNGNTLIADSRHFRVLEVNETGTVVWSYSLARQRGIVYEADRLSVPEEGGGAPAGNGSGSADAGPLADRIAAVESWAAFVFPPWVAFPELLTMATGLLVGGWLAVEAALLARRRGQ